MAPHPTATSGINVSDEFNALMARLDGVRHVLRDNAEPSDEQADLTTEVTRVLLETGALKVGIPRELRGYEFSPRQLTETVARISYEDASLGWTFTALQMATGTTAAHLGPGARKELFPDVENDHYALVTGHAGAPGAAVRVDGGYQLTGRWHFASGISLASHVRTMAHCEETGRTLVCTLDKDQVTLLDRWEATGLRATRSVDYTCDEVFVPDDRVYEATAVNAHAGGAIYRLGLATMHGICQTGWTLGVGRRMLDEMRALAARHTGTPRASVDTDQFHAEYANIESALRAARAWATEVWADNEATLDRGDLLSSEQQTLTRLMLHHTTWTVRQVAAFVYTWAGTASLWHSALQRFFRDLHTGTQHTMSGPMVLQDCGEHMSGLAPDSRWIFLDLQQG
ncbi:acyl-CoA dehydrogenase [Halostreptopolyspora alba]|uniref:Acyl-CoA dehydrogenase n=1 Tax=Halostreptopolyspora alba TaxID=2487137 RepID=A0A3N0E309_9ACTN|nr:acyl-CoA dehydrogenase [Nocardiopsaceae bacterium YIM 96095]